MPAYNLEPSLQNKLANLLKLVEARPGWVAFSGGVDSSLLLWATLEVASPDTVAIFADSPLQAEIDRKNCRSVADHLGASLRTVHLQPLMQAEFTANPPERCYLCKKSIYHEFLGLLPEGMALLDGTNLDDTGDWRPGRKALAELNVETPLLAAGLCKKEIRTLAYRLGLPNWDRPSASCLATRIPTGMVVTAELLRRIEQCETAIREIVSGHIRVRPVTKEWGHCLVELAREEMVGDNFTLLRRRISAALLRVGAEKLDFVAREGVFVNNIN